MFALRCDDCWRLLEGNDALTLALAADTPKALAADTPKALAADTPKNLLHGTPSRDCSCNPPEAVGLTVDQFSSSDVELRRVHRTTRTL